MPMITDLAQRALVRAGDGPGHDAATQAAVLATAADLSPDLYLRTLLTKVAREWIRVANDLTDLAEEGTTAVAVAVAVVAPGAAVYRPGRNTQWSSAVRVMTRDGQVSLHIEAEGRPEYLNLTLPGSPVVVLP